MDSSCTVNESSAKRQIEDGLRGMRPGEAMMVISKMLGQSSAQFLRNHLLKVVVDAAKSGKAKLSGISSALRGLGKKDAEDTSGIDWDKVEIDPMTMKFQCLFQGDGKEKVEQFVKMYESELGDIGDEAVEAEKKLQRDAKAAHIEMSPEEVSRAGVAVSSVIDDPRSKGKSGKRLTDEAKRAHKMSEQMKQVLSGAKSLKRECSKLSASSQKLSGKQIAKLAAEAGKKMRQRSEASKKNDNLRAKVKRAVQSGVSSKFTSSVKVMFMDSQKLKKRVAAGFKPGLSIDKIEEPRAICVSVRCKKSDFSKVLKEEQEQSSGKVVDISQGSSDKDIQGIVDYIKAKVTKAVGESNVGKFYACMKDAGKHILVYVAAGVKSSYGLSEAVNLGTGSPEQTALRLMSVMRDSDGDGIPDGFTELNDGTVLPDPDTYSRLSTKIIDLEEMLVDGKVDSSEMPKFASVANDLRKQLKAYVAWAVASKDSSDSLVKMETDVIENLAYRYQKLVNDNKGTFEEFFPQAGSSYTGAAGITKSAVRQVQDSKQMQKAAEGWKHALGLDTMFTAIGIARLAAKTAGLLLNHGKDIIDAAGAKRIAKQEDKDVIAQATFIVQDGEGSNAVHGDIKLSVRYSVADNKWHAACLDNRKMKLPEEEVIAKFFSIKDGKRFKKHCLSIWKPIFRPKDSRRYVIPFLLKNFDELGVKADGATKQFMSMMRKVSNNFDKIEQDFK